MISWTPDGTPTVHEMVAYYLTLWRTRRVTFRPSYGPLARNMRRSPDLAKLIRKEHTRNTEGNCAGCAAFTVIAYPCPLAELARESLNWIPPQKSRLNG